ESAARRDSNRFCQQVRRIEPCKPSPLAQVPLAIRIQLPACLGNRNVETGCSQCILQRSSFTHVHVNVTACYERYSEIVSQLLQRGQPLFVGSVEEQLDGNASLAPETVAQPVGFFQPPGVFGRASFRPTDLFLPGGRYPENATALQPGGSDILAAERITSFIGRAPPTRNQPAKPPITSPITGQRDELQPALETK